MDLRFVKMNPSENMTVFILDSVPRILQPEVAARIMAYGHLHCEQVAFVENASKESMSRGAHHRMQMMGGEFCGNAARCFGALMVHKGWPGITPCEVGYQAVFEASGAIEAITCTVTPTEKKRQYTAVSSMPIPDAIIVRELSQGGTASIVRLPGMVHVIVERAQYAPEPEHFHELRSTLGLIEDEAVGVMFYHIDTDGKHRIDPLVFIKATGTLYHERSCGSGSLALAAVLAKQQTRSIHMGIHQPGGVIQVEIGYDNGICSGAIGGPVSIVAEGTLYLDNF